MNRLTFKGWFDRLGIRAKLITITVLVTTFAVLVGAVTLFFVRAGALLDNELTRMRHIVQIAADFSQAPLSFADRAGAEQRLAYLQTIPEALQAYVLDGEGRTFASWGRDPALSTDWTPDRRMTISLSRDHYTVAAAVHSRDQRLGEVVILASTRLLHKQVFEYLGALLVVALVVIPVAVLLAVRMQSTISRPITHLAQVTRRVTAEGDYGLRVQPTSSDEVAELYHGFNDMLQHIELREGERDRAYDELQQIKDHLEDRVVQRTRQVTAANQALAAENAKLQQAEAALSRALAEKETLLREIHHRVKNNLQVIYSLLSLQIQAHPDCEDSNLLEDARQRVKTMALVHETLYGTADLARIPAGDFIGKVAGSLFEIYHAAAQGIELSITAEDVRLDLDRAIPLGLIINELTTNALKYAFAGRDRGLIDIRLRREDDHALALEVRDDGVGMRDGLDAERPGSLGLKLVKALVQQLRGELTVSGSPGNGVGFTVRFHGTDASPEH